MFGGHGSMQHMRNVLKANKALLDKRMNLFERGRRFSDIRKEYQLAADKKLDSKQLSAEELEKIRRNIIANRKAEGRKTMAIWLGTVFVLLLVVFVNREYIFNSNEHLPTAKTKVDIEKREKYLYCIEDGDKWLKKNGWHNAIFQYKEALELYPNDEPANRRLAIAYTYRCRSEKVNCDEAKSMIEEMLSTNPEDSKNHELLASYYFGIQDSVKAMEALDEAASLSN